jgi:flagella basal body P-ring formation protein FlgA
MNHANISHTVRRGRGIVALALGLTAVVAARAAGQANAPLALPEATFMSAGGRFSSAAVELRSEATIYGDEVRLKQIARWSDADAAALQPLAELIVSRIDAGTAYRVLTVDEVRTVLTEAGVNQATLRFTGVTSCRVTRSDVAFDENAALRAWVRPDAPAPVEDIEGLTIVDPIHAAKPQAAKAAATRNLSVATSDDAGVRNLRSMLVDDVASRLQVDRNDLQVDFKPADERVLNLSEPQFRFTIDPRRVRELGTVAWDVTILTQAGQHKASITATAQAWQEQVIVDKPIAAKQVIREGDVVRQRVLASESAPDTLVTLSQVVGQQATRNLPAGALLTARLVQAVPLVRAGQLVSVTLGQGGIRIKTVARAAESGTFGQTIKVKNETTRDVYDVRITGPQAGVVGDGAADEVAIAG